MEQEKVDLFIAMNQKYYPAEKIPFIAEKIKELPDEKYVILNAVEKKDPTTMLLVSIFVGWLGIDRFMLGETGMGVLKLLTLGCCYVLMIMDWFSITEKTKEYNYNNLVNFL